MKKSFDFIKPKRPTLPWLDPHALGATSMVSVPEDRILTIAHGPVGLVKFLANERQNSAQSPWDAYVVKVEKPKALHLFSKHQLRLALNLLSQGILSGDPAKYLQFSQARPSGKSLDLAAMVEFDASCHDILGRALKEDAEHLLIAVSDYFGLLKPGVNDQLALEATPSQPALVVQNGRAFQAWVPGTYHLERKAWKSMDADVLFSPPAVKAPARRGRVSSSTPPMDDVPSGSSRREGGTKSASTRTPAKPTLEIIRRTPHLQFELGAPYKVGQTFVVEVFADNSAADSDATTKDIEIKAPAGTKEFPLKVWLTGSQHFEVHGAATQTIVLQRKESRTTHAKFQVRVLDNKGGEPRLTAIFQYKGRPCGSVSKPVDLVAPGQAVLPPAPPDPFELDPQARVADLTVVIKTKTKDGKIFDCSVTTPHLPEFAAGKESVWQLGDPARSLVQAHFEQFTDSEPQSPAQRIANLRGAGMSLFDGAPEDFQQAFWQLIDQGKPLRTISVVSDEPYIPWELMVPRRMTAAGMQSRDLSLGADFAVGRWISKWYVSPVQHVPFSKSWVFAPRYPGDKDSDPAPLLFSEDEARLVTTTFSGNEITPADFVVFENSLKTDARSLLHFVCHGTSPGAGSQKLICQDLTPLLANMIEGSSATAKACGLSRPFVFINACEVGRTTPALLGTGGFAASFIAVGSKAIIAPLWSVDDALAHEIAKVFYQATHKNPKKPFAEILRDVRAKAYTGKAQDTWAAYCFYGDPFAAREQ